MNKKLLTTAAIVAFFIADIFVSGVLVLFPDASKFFHEMGYTVRLFNLVQPELSDRWNCLAEINGNELMAQTFADVVVMNTNTGRKRGIKAAGR
jgi:hypothetical protein